MSCEGCKHDNMTDEAKAVRATSEMAQRYKMLCRAVIALVIGFAIMAICMVWTVTNAQRIANEAVLQALNTVAEMEVTSETTTTTEVTQDTGEGNGNNVYLDGDNTTYNEGGGD